MRSGSHRLFGSIYLTAKRQGRWHIAQAGAGRVWREQWQCADIMHTAAATHPRMECCIVNHCERARAVGVRARTWRCEELRIGQVRRRNPGAAAATHICPEKASAASLRRLSADSALTSRAADLAPTGAPSSRHETGSVCAPAIEAGRTAGRVGQASVGRKSAHNDFAAKGLTDVG